MFDATTNNKSNGEILEGSDLNVNVAATGRKAKPSILRGQLKKQFKSCKMPSEAIAKIMANSYECWMTTII